MQMLSSAPPSASTASALGRLLENLRLTPDELSILRELGWELRTARRRQPLVVEGAKLRLVYLVLDGFLIRYRILRDGQRQIVNVTIPGDFAGVPSCFFADSLYTVRALTDATVAALPLDRLVALFETHPRIPAKIFWSFSCESAIYAERLVVVSRRPALERIAHFLLELLTRLQRAGLADERSFKMPLRQHVIGDALGLSLAYVNRVLRQLADDGLVFIRGDRIIINNVDALSSLADFEHGYLRPMSMTEFSEATV